MTDRKRAEPTEEAQIRALIDDWAERAPQEGRRRRRPPSRRGVRSLLARAAAWQIDASGEGSRRGSPLGTARSATRSATCVIAAGDDVAFSHSLEPAERNARSTAESSDVWFRHTFGLRKIGGDWKIVHEHESVPFYMDGSFGPPSTSSGKSQPRSDGAA